MRKLIRTFEHSFRFPPTEPPQWSSQVVRWNQLDAAAFGTADMYSHLKSQLQRPDLILLASPGASNETDSDFAQGGASSPMKFVHTLPSVRCSSMLELMNWSGPVLCFQKDPLTFQAALQEAVGWLTEETLVVWVLGVFFNQGTCSVQLVELVARSASDRSLITEQLKGEMRGLFHG